MLSDDIIREVATIADYNTTIILIEVFPILENIWQEKCQKLYPDKTYLSSFTAQENFLLKERIFFLPIEYYYKGGYFQINNILSPISRQNYDETKYIAININKRFLVLRKELLANRLDFYIPFQCDSKDECVTVKEENEKYENGHCDHYIIDSNDLSLHGAYREVQYVHIEG